MRDLTFTTHPHTGLTCLHGHFSAYDMQWLLQLAPTGTFLPDFHVQHSRNIDWLHFMQLRTHNGFLRRAQVRPFWFQYDDVHRATLLVALYLRGFMSPEQEKVA